MGSESCNNSQPANADNTKELKSELFEGENINNHTGKHGDDQFNQGLSKVPDTPESNIQTAKPVFQQQNINTAVKNIRQLGDSNTERDNNVSTHISMSVSGQARVNSNVSR